MSKRVLLIDDDKDLLKLVSMRLKSDGFDVASADGGRKGLAMLDSFQPQVVVTDLRMDDIDGMAVFEYVKANRPSLPVIMLTAHGSIPHALEATRRGAFAYLTKPFDSAELISEINSALQAHGDTDEESSDGFCARIVTRSPLMKEVLAQARMVARSDTSVLIQSESGTGKELLARSIHDASERADKPFLAINCSAVPESLLESELFGHSKGAFTGATKNHDGLFQAAYGGTLFLDEVGDMPLGFQAKLLRVLQEREVRPVGSTTSVPIDVRIISATHFDLEKEVEEQNFRKDLYYRLNVVQLTLPPLRERRDDIPLLANHFLREQAQSKGQNPKRFSAEALEILVSAAWPGNVRQLQNIVEQTTVLSSTQVIPAQLVQNALKMDSGEIPSFAEARDNFEREYLAELLNITQGNVSKASNLAKRNRTEFYRLLHRHHLDPSEYRGRRQA
ncbi:two-component system response regulator GlrR [Litorivivens lipolytica]|uniref:Two-component system response regulator GlrR n=1 Tax=Litorivivens lipolytica TaxID=1524264 RepID=A0A7W4W579_9GAMM|nr:sigma 54-interacting transcriptional regulator [Litorivivens lipolytica]MBB3047565.1 two-component system response regulator GlrR [Litorivivens lipolytica]